MPTLRPRDGAQRAQTSIRKSAPVPAPKKKKKTTASKVTKKKPAKKVTATPAVVARTTASAAAGSSDALAVGDNVPDAVLKTPLTRGKAQTSLEEELRGSEEGGLIVFVYPKAFTDEAAEFVADFERRIFDYEPTYRSVIGLSPDSNNRNNKLEIELDLKIKFLSDEKRRVLKPLGIGLTKKSKVNQGAAFALDKDGTLAALRVGRMDTVLDKFDRNMDQLDLTVVDREEEEDVMVI